MRCISILFLLICIAALGCDNPKMNYQLPKQDSSTRDTLPVAEPDSAGLYTTIETGSTTPAQLIAFARTLQGIPYREGATDPARGFDCSGFITYVFNHFGIKVPRRSVDFTHINHEVNLSEARAGDLVLFTGTDSTIRVVGHMGIIVSPKASPVVFIHSTSGKAKGVTETPLNAYYMGRFVKVVRVFAE